MKHDDFNLKEPQLPEYFRGDIDIPSEQMVNYYEPGQKKHSRVISMVGVRHEFYKIISAHPDLQIGVVINNGSHPLRKIYTHKSRPVYDWFGVDRKQPTSFTKDALRVTLYALWVGYKAALIEKYLFGQVQISADDMIISESSCNTFLIQLTKNVEDENAAIYKKLVDGARGNNDLTPAVRWEMHRKRTDLFLNITEKKEGSIGPPISSGFLHEKKTSTSARRQEFIVLRYLIDSGFFFGRIMAIEDLQSHLRLIA